MLDLDLNLNLWAMLFGPFLSAPFAQKLLHHSGRLRICIVFLFVSVSFLIVFFYFLFWVLLLHWHHLPAGHNF